MPVSSFMLRLHRRGRISAIREEVTDLDPAAPGVLREHLRRMVTDVTRGLRVDLSMWSLVVHNPSGGRVRYRLTIDNGGRSVIKRVT